MKQSLYTKLKIFHFKDKIDSLPKDSPEILPPIHIRIKPTNVCNHNCWYCAYKAKYLQLGKDMVKKDHIPKDKMFEIVDDLDKMGVKAVTFSGGGDPFCYPYLAETLKKLIKTEIVFASLTNGSRLEGEAAKLFAKHGTWLRVSIDGWDNDSYAKYRGVKPGEFSKVMENMENFKKLEGNCYLGISLIVDEKNTSHIYEFVERLCKLGVDSVKISPCVVSNSGIENNQYHRKIFDQVKEAITKTMADFSSDSFEIFDAYHELDKTFDKDYNWCPYLQILPIIGADLNIYSCQDKAYNLDEGLVGSIKDRRFKDFWFSDKNVFYKIDPTRDCNNHCVANAKNKMLIEYLNAKGDHLGFV